MTFITSGTLEGQGREGSFLQLRAEKVGNIYCFSLSSVVLEKTFESPRTAKRSNQSTLIPRNTRWKD